MSSDMRVLLAHFDAEQLDRLSELFRSEGAEVFLAREGPQAVHLAKECQPHLAFVSTLLPGMSGFEVCRNLSEGAGDQGPPPVVLMSDVDDPYVRARARHVGAKRTVVEPLDSDEVRELLEVSWPAVDPLQVSEGEEPPNLMKELLGQKESAPGLISKLADPLTGLMNEEYIRLKTDEECRRAARSMDDLSLLIAEIDNFDQILSAHGRRAGDEALLEVAGVFLCESRDVDVAARVHPARFLLLMPNTPREGGSVAACRIYESLTERRLNLDDEDVELVISLGLATIRGADKMSADDLLHLAESDLAVARRRGTVPVSPSQAQTEKA